MRALCVIGSPSPESHTGALVHHISQLMEKRGFVSTVANLAELRLPHCDPRFYWSDEPHPDPAVRSFVETAYASDAVVLGTPVHHAGYSGVLKSALDLLPFDAFENKAIGLAANAGGARGSASACEQLRQVVKALGGWPVPVQVSTVSTDFDQSRTLDEEGAPHQRCVAMADQLTTFTRAMRTGETDRTA